MKVTAKQVLALNKKREVTLDFSISTTTGSITVNPGETDGKKGHAVTVEMDRASYRKALTAQLAQLDALEAAERQSNEVLAAA